MICTFGGASLYYEYYGGQDNVTSLETNVSDTYVVNYSNDTSLNIMDWGGDNDFLTVIGTTLNDMRILFNIEKTYSDEWQCNTNHVILTNTSNVSKDMLSKSALENATLVNGINLKGEIENVSIGGQDVSVETWCDQIKSNVVEWLTDAIHSYDSVAEALANCNDESALEVLVGYYQNNMAT